jgi:hypothetical protein
MKDQHKQSDSLTASRRNPTSRKALPRLTLRIDFDAGRAVGPGKIKLMELIDKHVDAAQRRLWPSGERARSVSETIRRGAGVVGCMR